MSIKEEVTVRINNMAADPGPPLFGRFIVLLSLVVAVMFLGLALVFSSGGRASFAAKLVLMTVVLGITPSILKSIIGSWGKFILAVGQAITLTLIIAIFSIWLIGISMINLWIGVLFLLLLVLLMGAYLLDLVQDRITIRLTNSQNFSLASTRIFQLERNRERQTINYISIPLGLITSVIFGWATNLGNVEILTLSVPLILFIYCLLLSIALIASAKIMIDSLILFDLRETTPSIQKESGSSFLDFFKGYLKIQLPTSSAQEQNFSRSLDMAYLASDLRKLYFYDSVHNIILLLGFSLSILSIVNLKLMLDNKTWIILIAFFILFISCYFPYSIGQYHLHESIIEAAKMEGLNRKKLKDELIAASPIYPQSDFINALIATGTIGGLLTTLAYDLMKKTLGL